MNIIVLFIGILFIAVPTLTFLDLLLTKEIKSKEDLKITLMFLVPMLIAGITFTLVYINR